MQMVNLNPRKGYKSVGDDVNKLWDDDLDLIPAYPEISAMDVYEEDDQLVAEVNLPGFSKDEIKVSSDEGQLEVYAKHREKKEEEAKRRYLLHETSDEFLRRFTLPDGVDVDNAEAIFDKGLLRVTMPLSVEKHTKELRVK